MLKIVLELRFFLALLAVATISSGLIYATVQQDLRQGANDPQIQIVEDLKNILPSSSDKSLIPNQKIDPSKSLDVFEIVYDSKGQVLQSNVSLNDKVPELPQGVLKTIDENSAKENKQTRFTWQPQIGVRIAAVMDKFSGNNSGYILVGRSMKVVEEREDFLMKMVLVGWLAEVLIIIFFTSLPRFFKK